MSPVWPEDAPKPEVHFLSLTPKEQARYEEIRKKISDILANEHGLAYLINAIVAKSHEGVTLEILAWIEATSDIEARDLTAYAFDRPIDVPKLFGQDIPTPP